eukprot:scaffold106194_cov37-Prasinocladus_malaysianus.AAC.1
MVKARCSYVPFFIALLQEKEIEELTRKLDAAAARIADLEATLKQYEESLGMEVGPHFHAVVSMGVLVKGA